jgi:hypothetical protein
MHHFLSRLFVCFSLFAGTAFAAPGYLWEISMETEDMPFAMPKQKICAEKDSREPPVSQDDQECRVQEKKQTGNRFSGKHNAKTA